MASSKLSANKDDNPLDKILILAISGLIFVIVMIAILFFHYISLHYALLNDNTDLLHEVDDLQETTEQLQSQLDEMLTTPAEAISVQDIQAIDEQLEDLDENLDTLETVLEENSVESIADVPWLEDFAPNEATDIDTLQENINRTLLLITWFIGIASLVTALLLAVTLRNRKRPKRRLLASK